MLLVYLDESGIGDVKNEKYVVVAGVIVEAEQYKAVEKRIGEVRDKYVPEKYRKGFVFHATDLFGGSERRISRDEFPTHERHNALEELISILKELNLPVVQAWAERQPIRDDHPEMNAREAVVFTQAIAATSCMLLVEAFTRRYALASTLALITYENNDQARELVKTMHKQMQDAENVKKISDRKEAERISKVVPLPRVIDIAHFAEKSEAPILQLADACAYFIKRKMMGCDKSDRFLAHVLGQLTTNEHSLWPMGKA